MEENGGSLLALLLMLAGLACIVAGKGAAKKVLTMPFKWAAEIIAELLSAVMELVLQLLGQLLRALGRVILRGLRRLFRLPPPGHNAP